MMLIAVSAGCMGSSAASANKPVQTPIPVITAKPPSVIIENESDDLITVEVEVTPMSAQDTEQEWMYRTHGRYLGDTITEKRYNISGQKDLTLTFSVYDYQMMTYYQESGADSWGTHHWWMHKAPQGQKFLFVFLREEMEGTDQSHDPRIWGFGPSSVRVTVNNQFVSQDPGHYPCVAIKQMENRGTFNDESRVSDFGKLRLQSLSNGKEECQDLGVLRMGRSNQWDGYLIYLVPSSTTPDQVKVLWNFAAFGDAWWTLTKKV